MGIRITTWNVNGIRNPFGYHPWREKRTFDSMFDTLEADIVIFQELKIQRKDMRDDMVLIPGWDVFFSLPKHKKGYSGVGIFTRQSACAPIRAEEGLLGVLCPPNSSLAYRDMPAEAHIGGYLSASQLAAVNVDPVSLDSEGRCVIIEFPAFVLFGLYSPANSSGTRDDFRHAFLQALDMRVRNLDAQGKRVIVCGDLNVSREQIDTANAEESIRKEGLTYEQYLSTPNRRIFNQLLEAGRVCGDRDEGREHPVLWDVCRGFHPTRTGMFTHWEQKINARPGNFGSRIDFILSSLSMTEWFSKSDIQEGLMGSDHCPVYAILKDVVNLGGIEVQLQDILNPDGMVRDGVRHRPCEMSDLPAFSARLMPEFDKRRNIKDMFGRVPSSQSECSAVLGSSSGKKNNAAADKREHNRAYFATAPDSNVHPHPDSFPHELSQSHSSPKANSTSPIKRARLDEKSPKPSKKRDTHGMVGNQQRKISSQQNIEGFFKPRPSNKHHVGDNINEIGNNIDVIRGQSNRADHTPTPKLQSSVLSGLTPGTSIDNKSEKALPDWMIAADDKLVDPEASKASWSKLLAKPDPPLCEHSEPCKLMKTKKPGINCGREFWMCQRPLGPSGDKERNSQWRCTTFVWCSDRKR